MHLTKNPLTYANFKSFTNINMLDLINNSNISDTNIYYLTINFKFINDEDVVLAAVLKNGLELKFASDILKNNKEIVLAAIRQNKDAIEYASKNLKVDPEVLHIVQLN
jgi:hypothetical protein